MGKNLLQISVLGLLLVYSLQLRKPWMEQRFLQKTSLGMPQNFFLMTF